MKNHIYFVKVNMLTQLEFVVLDFNRPKKGKHVLWTQIVQQVTEFQQLLARVVGIHKAPSIVTYCQVIMNGSTSVLFLMTIIKLQGAPATQQPDGNPALKMHFSMRGCVQNFRLIIMWL